MTNISRKPPGQRRRIGRMSQHIGPMPNNNRDRVSNGSCIAHGIDLRSRAGRRWRHVYESSRALVDPSFDHLCRNLATLIVAREQVDADLIAGRRVDADELIRFTNAIGRTVARLGLARPPTQLGALLRAAKQAAATPP